MKNINMQVSKYTCFFLYVHVILFLDKVFLPVDEFDNKL